MRALFVAALLAALAVAAGAAHVPFDTVLPLTRISQPARVATEPAVLLTVSYCPTAFTGRGAVVSVNPTSGDYAVVGTFDWPSSATFGCPLEQTPTVAYDHVTEHLFLDFTSAFGFMTIVDLSKATVLHKITPKDPFFVGFDNMVYNEAFLRDTVKGVSGTVTQSGYCSDGCFQFGALSTLSGSYKNLSNIPFKAAMDDSHFLDPKTNIFHIQASYDLRETGRCAPIDYDLCLLQIDANTGALVDSKFSNFTVYKYAPELHAPNTLLAFIEGDEAECQGAGGSDYQFAYVDLVASQFKTIACLPKSVVVHEDEWIAAFSPDETYFATGSGDAETGEPQLLVFSTASGAQILNTKLPGLANKLGTYLGMFDIWAVDFATKA